MTHDCAATSNYIREAMRATAALAPSPSLADTPGLLA